MASNRCWTTTTVPPPPATPTTATGERARRLVDKQMRCVPRPSRDRNHHHHHHHCHRLLLRLDRDSILDLWWRRHWLRGSPIAHPPPVERLRWPPPPPPPPPPDALRSRPRSVLGVARFRQTRAPSFRSSAGCGRRRRCATDAAESRSRPRRSAATCADDPRRTGKSSTNTVHCANERASVQRARARVCVR